MDVTNKLEEEHERGKHQRGNSTHDAGVGIQKHVRLARTQNDIIVTAIET